MRAWDEALLGAVALDHRYRAAGRSQPRSQLGSHADEGARVAIRTDAARRSAAGAGLGWPGFAVRSPTTPGRRCRRRTPEPTRPGMALCGTRFVRADRPQAPFPTAKPRKRRRLGAAVQPFCRLARDAQ